ncbi:MAG: hypothetical protein GC181_01345 [Bacteroidetes bacterium]|nr:hypothetical protein [Bacteroidota bacterium]
MINIFRLSILLLITNLFYSNTKANTVEYIKSDEAILVGKYVSYTSITSDSLVYDLFKTENRMSEWKHSNKSVLNLGFDPSIHVLKFHILNNSNSNNLRIEIAKPSLDLVKFYLNNKLLTEITEGANFKHREIQDPHPTFNFLCNKGDSVSVCIVVQSKDEIILPIYLGSQKVISERSMLREVFFGIFAGIMIVMLFHNFFIYLSLKDNIYILYFINIVILFIGQASLLGYSNKYIWPYSTYFPDISIVLFPLLTIVVGMLYVFYFLDMRSHFKSSTYIVFGFISICIVGIIIGISGGIAISSLILRIAGAVSALYVIITSLILARKGLTSAKYLFFAWSFFLVGVILFVLKDLNVLQYNIITNYSMTIGSALETILLSFALADRINTLKKEREDSQRQMLEEMRKNRDLTENLNRELEQKVAERTRVLEITNNDLNETLANLKATQGQLIEAEKMASLGQLTAGIAHEINNPINFVSSNVDPLRNDIKDVLHILNQYNHYADQNEIPELKKIIAEAQDLDINYSIQEINQLIDGIEEGAKRTSEIVTGLKNFSRTDEEELKLSDINDGLRSTITILKSQLRNIKVDVTYGKIPKVKCQLGKLNQVFMNLIDNSIDAIRDKWGDTPQGLLTISTEYVDGEIKITTTDNGNGIPDEIITNIFDPFFTTKDVGEGTGLGLSISYGIIEKHSGKIEVSSTRGEGTTFVISIPGSNTK